ncbi:MAG: A/G-specific adenine glycosylase [bacterium]|nr:A/G-specific adenine glycosylase [bacterium]
MKPDRIRVLRRVVWRYYRRAGRDLPWRRTRNPYRILVSEVMLQQTQAERVLSKYREFLHRFPTVRALAEASLSEVLRAWSGLGYNRRALFLKTAAEIILAEHGGRVPRRSAALERLPGVGAYTARAILCFAFDEPTVFLETNIRTVFIHHFFAERIRRGSGVSDRELLPLIGASLDRRDPREWYFALMDYGAHLKQTVGNVSRASTQYARQSAFRGSAREARGRTLKLLVVRAMSETELVRLSTLPRDRIRRALASLARDGLVEKTGKRYALTA